MAGAFEVRRRNRSLARGCSSVVKLHVKREQMGEVYSGESTWPSFPRGTRGKERCLQLIGCCAAPWATFSWGSHARMAARDDHPFLQHVKEFGEC